MSKRSVRSPSLDKLKELLGSDPATKAFIGDAKAIMDGHDVDADEPTYSYITEVLRNVSDEVDPTYSDMCEGENEEEDLKSIATSCKRGALLLLCAAHEAEQRVARLKRAEVAPKRKRTAKAQTTLPLAMRDERFNPNTLVESEEE